MDQPVEQPKVETKKETVWHRRFGPKVGPVVAFCVEVVQIVVVSAAIVLPVRYFLIQPFDVKGASMQPNFYDGQYLVIDELSDRFSQPDRGQVIVFRYPLDPSQFFIKRVIGLPGETVQVADGHLTIYNAANPNGFVLSEPYLAPGTVTSGTEKLTLGSDQYFVMGDNRPESLDSRSFGPITASAIVGRVWLRGLPLSSAGIIPIPSYGNN